MDIYDTTSFPDKPFSLFREITHMGYDRQYEGNNLTELTKEELKKLKSSTEKEISKLKSEFEDMSHGRAADKIFYPLKERIKREEDYLDRIENEMSNR